jgi:hypothetical protein
MVLVTNEDLKEKISVIDKVLLVLFIDEDVKVKNLRLKIL